MPSSKATTSSLLDALNNEMVDLTLDKNDDTIPNFKKSRESTGKTKDGDGAEVVSKDKIKKENKKTKDDDDKNRKKHKKSKHKHEKRRRDEKSSKRPEN